MKTRLFKKNIQDMEDFVSFETAKKLKEKGFPQGNKDYIREKYYIIKSVNGNVKWYCPTIAQVLKWLRDEKKLYIEPCILVDANTDADGRVINEYIYWSFSITSIESGDMIYFEYEQHIDDKRFDSYEEAAIAGIEHCLDNLI